jgi:hypothetical protein
MSTYTYRIYFLLRGLALFIKNWIVVTIQQGFMLLVSENFFINSRCINSAIVQHPTSVTPSLLVGFRYKMTTFSGRAEEDEERGKRVKIKRR